jgi:ABC-type transport system substrate-binding protein
MLRSIQSFSFEEIRVSLEKMPSSIDPTEIRAVEGHFIQRQIFETLIEKSGNGVYLPVLAESWEISADMKSFSLRLKSNVKFSDGSELFADDIVKVVELQGSKFTSRAIEGLDDFINGRSKKIKGLIKSLPYDVVFNFTETFPKILDDLRHCP